MTALDQVNPALRAAVPAGGGKLRPYTTSPALRRVLLVLVTVVLVGAAEAAACPVCYGQAQGDVVSGARLSIVFLGALVYALIGGGVAVLFALRRRVRRNLDPHHGLRLVHTETRSS